MVRVPPWHPTIVRDGQFSPYAIRLHSRWSRPQQANRLLGAGSEFQGLLRRWFGHHLNLLSLKPRRKHHFKHFNIVAMAQLPVPYMRWLVYA